MMARPRRHGAFVDTKVHSISLRDYGPQDGWRGPDVTFGWGYATVSLYTHKIDGLHENDFILAAKIDAAA